MPTLALIMKTYADDIEHAYARSRDAALTAWAKREDCGNPAPATYHKTHLGVSTGERFAPSDWIADCHADALRCVGGHASIDLVPRDCLHFTFLALALHEYPTLADLPVQIESVRKAYLSFVASVEFTIHKVRLVPLRNALVLAGIPDESSFNARGEFAKALLAGPWAPFLRARYAGFDVPPIFWHTTLVRSETEYLSPDLREIYHQYSDQSVDRITLGHPRLVASRYNWSVAITL